MNVLLDTLYNLAGLHYEKGNYPASITILEECLALFTSKVASSNPTFQAGILRLLSLCFVSTGALDRATQCCEASLKQDPCALGHLVKFQLALACANAGASGDGTDPATCWLSICKAPDFDLSQMAVILSLCLKNNNLDIARDVIDQIISGGTVKLKRLITKQQKLKGSSLFILAIQILNETREKRTDGDHFSRLMEYCEIATAFIKDLSMSSLNAQDMPGESERSHDGNVSAFFGDDGIAPLSLSSTFFLLCCSDLSHDSQS